MVAGVVPRGWPSIVMRAPEGSLRISSAPVALHVLQLDVLRRLHAGLDRQRDHARLGLADLHFEHVRARWQAHRDRRDAGLLAIDDNARALRARLHGELALARAHAAAGVARREPADGREQQDDAPPPLRAAATCSSSRCLLKSCTWTVPARPAVPAGRTPVPAPALRMPVFPVPVLRSAGASCAGASYAVPALPVLAARILWRCFFYFTDGALVRSDLRGDRIFLDGGWRNGFLDRLRNRRGGLF